MIEEQLQSIQKQYEKLVAEKEVSEGVEITAQFRNEAMETDNIATFEWEQTKGKKNQSALEVIFIF